MNEIVIRFSDEDRALLARIAGNLERVADLLAPGTPVVMSSPALHPVDAPVTQFEPPAPAPDPVAEAPAPAPISLPELQKALSTRCAESDTMKQKVQALIRKYAECVSAIPEDKRPEVLAALDKI
jgi:hypothetical protein